MPQICLYHPCSKELSSVMSEWLTPSSTNSHNSIMMCFKRLPMDQIKRESDTGIEPHQYGYKKNKKSTTDMTSYIIHLALTHLE